MTKEDIVNRIYNVHGLLSKNEATIIFENIFEYIKNHLKEEGKIKISNFGTFQVRKKNARLGRNPQSGEPMEISARRVLTFKPSKNFRNLVNN